PAAPRQLHPDAAAGRAAVRDRRAAADHGSAAHHVAGARGMDRREPVRDAAGTARQLGASRAVRALGAGVPVAELSPSEVLQRWPDRANVVLLDVREPAEVAVAAVAGAVHIPMGEIPARLAELDPERPIVVM